MRLIRVMMAVVILSMLAGVFSQTAWAGPVSVGIAIGVPAPVVVYPAPVYYPPAYAYGPPPYGPGVVLYSGPGYWYHGHYYHGHHHRHGRHGYHGR